MMCDPPWPVRTVCLDAAGTLFRVRGSVGELYGRYAAGFGFQGADDRPGWLRIEKQFAAAFKAQPPMSFPGAPVSSIGHLERRWWRNLVEETFAPLGDFPRIDEFFNTLYEVFQTSEAWELEPGCEVFLSEMRQREKRLGVISNFDSRLERVLKELGIREYFENIILSSRGPAAKPDRNIFEHALARLDSRPQESVHIGDHIEQDYRGARSAGMMALLYDPRRRTAADFPGYRISSLAEAGSFLL